MTELGYFTIAVNLINSLLPFGFAWVLYQNYTRKRLRFYLLWLIGFTAYGLSNSLNSINVYYGDPNPLSIAGITIFSLITFSTIVTGIGELTNKAKRTFILSLGAPLILGVLYLFGAPVDAINLFFMLPYVIITGALLALQIRYKADLNTPLLGFTIILLSNVGFATGEMSITVAPIFSILGKSILFYWMTLPRFSLITEDFAKFMVGPSAPIIDELSNWIYMVETPSENGLNNWIKKRVNSRHTQDTRSILLILDDKITQGSLKHSGLIDEPELYIIKCTPGPHKLGAVFSGRYMEISNNIDELSILLSDIMDFIEVNKTNTQLFFFDFSTLILNHGWKRVYTFLISLIHQLKAKKIQTFFIYTPESQKNLSEIQILRHLGDQVIQLSKG